MKGKPVAEQEIGKQLLSETVGYAETSVCRRRVLLNYFGEKYESDNCNSCDNCLHPKPLIEAQDEMSLLLETILAVKEKHQAEHIVNILIGQLDQQVKNYKHNALEVFAEGVEQGERFWTTLIRQSILAGLLTKDIDNYGLLKVSDEGQSFLKNPTSFKIAIDSKFEDADADEDDETGAGGGGAADEQLFEMLKTLRKNVAKQKNLPPFVVFQDPSLEEMATNYPITIDELKNITGVGTGKASKYGKPFIELIKKYVDENEIDRPDDMVVKSVVNKSGLKVHIIQNIDRRISLDDMAKSKGLKLEDIIGEIESIVASGTRVDIQYYINEVIDEERLEEVFDYFRTAENDTIEAAINEMGENEYTVDEIRLIRIKFMSEVAN
jgi:ATP-dependent DNA helicase RecQ